MAIKTIFKPKYEHPDPLIRKKAVLKLTDKDLLAKIACEDEDKGVRLAAVDKIYDQNLLAEVAVKARYDDVRLMAVDKISDQSILADIIRRRKNYAMTIAALAKITDKDIIAHIARSDQYNIFTRRTAIEMFADQSSLIDIARAITMPQVKKKAIDKIEDQELKESMMAEMAGKGMELSDEELKKRLELLVENYGEEQTVDALGKLLGSAHAIRSLGIMAKREDEIGQKARSYLEKACRLPNEDIAKLAKSIINKN